MAGPPAISTVRRVLLATFALVLALPALASASYPGLNGKIAYSTGGDIHAINPDGTGDVALTTGPASDRYPSYSPDGSKIAFARDFRIYTMNADGSNQTLLTPGVGVFNETEATWSPDGSKIAFSNTRSGLYDVWTINADGTGLFQVTATNASTMAFRPAWGPGNKIAYEATPLFSLRDIYTINPNGTGITNITSHPAYDGFPGWKSDGLEVYFTSQRTGQFEIFSGPVGGGPAVNLTSNAAHDQDAQGSPDGTKVVWQRNSGIWTMNANGTGQTQLVPSGAEPDWAPITDTTPPDTTILTNPPANTNSTAASFTFNGTDPPTGSLPLTFQCRRDAGAWNSCTSPENYTAAEGQRSFEVRAIDAVGNVDPTPASYAWKVDLTDPDITITNPAEKERYLLHDPISPVFNCTDPLAGAPPAASGIASCTATPVDNETLGPHEFKVTAVDNAGNSSTKSVAYVIDPPRYGDFVLDDHPVAYYRHNEAYPSSQDPQEITMVDSSGNGHNGTYKNDVALARTGAISCERRPHPPRACEQSADPENKAAFFPERDGYGYTNNVPSSPSGYTMEAWVKPRRGGAMMIMSHGRAGQFFIDDSGRLAFEQSQDTVSGAGPVIDSGSWWHVAATWDRATGMTRLYVNGVQVNSSSTANKEPSGTSTLYVGYGEKAPWFNGEIDESALYDYALSAHRINDRNKIGRAKDNPSVQAGNSNLNTEAPFTDPVMPKNNGLYAPTKVPPADFGCSDPDDTAPFPAAGSDIASCTATIDGNPVNFGDALPDSIGVHTFVVTATDKGGNTYVHTHTYDVQPFSTIYGRDPLLAYYRMGDGSGTFMQDSSPNNRHGEYKNGTDQGPVGIAGDGDTARRFTGENGYGFRNDIAAPIYQSTLEAWIDPDDHMRDQSFVGHGDGGELYLEGGIIKFRHGPQNRVVSSGVSPNASGFTQVVGTWDGVDLRIYVDGVLKGTVESSRRPSSVSTFYVGYGEIKPWFAGNIDEVAYYSTALTPNRVFQHWLADPPADGTGSGGGSTGGGGSSSGGSSGDPGTAGDPGSGGSAASSGTATVSAPKLNGKKLTATIGCSGDGPCSGNISARAKSRTLKIDLGSVGYDLAAAESALATFKLSKRNARTLKRLQVGFIEVKLTDSAGATVDTARLAR